MSRSCPAGGCRLTDLHFVRRVKEAFAHDEDGVRDMTLLRYGRHFRLPSGVKVIVKRNEKENSILTGLAAKDDVLMEAADFPSPITLVRGAETEEEIRTAASICARYSDCPSEPVEIRTGNRNGWDTNPLVESASKEWRPI